MRRGNFSALFVAFAVLVGAAAGCGDDATTTDGGKLADARPKDAHGDAVDAGGGTVDTGSPADVKLADGAADSSADRAVTDGAVAGDGAAGDASHPDAAADVAAADAPAPDAAAPDVAVAPDVAPDLAVDAPPPPADAPVAVDTAPPGDDAAAIDGEPPVPGDCETVCPALFNATVDCEAADACVFATSTVDTTTTTNFCFANTVEEEAVSTGNPDVTTIKVSKGGTACFTLTIAEAAGDIQDLTWKSPDGATTLGTGRRTGGVLTITCGGVAHPNLYCPGPTGSPDVTLCTAGTCAATP